MYLMYSLNAEGKREYTLKKVHPEGRPVFSAHPGKHRTYYMFLMAAAYLFLCFYFLY